MSASPQAVAEAVGGIVSHEVSPDADCALFAINPSAGIDAETIELWHGFDDYLTPRMVVVTGLEGMELDFDDAVLVANRVFDQLVTPYLVLHDDSGSPVALINLESQLISDYSTKPPSQHDSDSEHKELIAPFRDEYLEAVAEFDEDSFAAGVLFPAIPLDLRNGLGLDVVRGYLERLPSGS